MSLSDISIKKKTKSSKSLLVTSAPVNDRPADTRFSDTLLHWFDTFGRHDLPWQQDKTSYRVWVSEIMLQQTQVATVIPYYHRFMEAFPSLSHLAAAPLDEVLAHWAGLGYYARGRNLHKAAGLCAEHHNGQLPETLEGLQALPGIGRSTAGAILSISQNLRATILDGNVKRVLSRYLGIQEWPGSASVESKLWAYAEHLTPDNRVGEYTQAIMDLGATQCTRSKPKCQTCPFSDSCWAYLNERTTDIPIKKPRKALLTKQVWLLVVRNNEGSLLFTKRPPSGIWGGLWTLPEIPKDEHDLVPEQYQQALAREHGGEIKQTQMLPAFKHTFSHYHLEMTPVLIEIGSTLPSHFYVKEDTNQWLQPHQLEGIGLPAPIKKLLATMQHKA